MKLCCPHYGLYTTKNDFHRQEKRIVLMKLPEGCQKAARLVWVGVDCSSCGSSAMVKYN